MKKNQCCEQKILVVWLRNAAAPHVRCHVCVGSNDLFLCVLAACSCGFSIRAACACMPCTYQQAAQHDFPSVDPQLGHTHPTSSRPPGTGRESACAGCVGVTRCSPCALLYFSGLQKAKLAKAAGPFFLPHFYLYWLVATAAALIQSRRREKPRHNSPQ